MQQNPSVETNPVQADAVQPPMPQARPDYDTVPVEQVLAPEEQPDTPPDYYRSQAEVDRAIGRRLAAARAKWEREAAGAANPAGAEPRPVGAVVSLAGTAPAQPAPPAGVMPAAGAGAEPRPVGDAALLADAAVSSPVSDVASPAGMPPAQPAPTAGVMPAAGAGVSPAAGDAFTRQVLKGVAAIQVAYDPAFTLEGGFEASPDFKRLCLAGWDPVQAYELTLGREADGRAELDHARQRRASRPNPAPGGNGGVRVDFRNMTEANFKRIDERLKRGEHVRI
ncbi:MAG: hypothetical protein ACOYJA_07375 [Christensenellales bacterium]|jgi:hypothetical protein